MSIVLSVDNLYKSYSTVRALNGVSFEVPENSVFGILGPNGSGKTTLLGIIMDVLRPNDGGFRWFGKPGSSDQRKKIGTLLETPNFYSYLSATDNLKITQAISGRATGNQPSSGRPPRTITRTAVTAVIAVATTTAEPSLRSAITRATSR